MSKQKKLKRQEPARAKILLAVITLINITLSIALKIMNRQETLKVLKDENELRVIAMAKKENKVKI